MRLVKNEPKYYEFIRNLRNDDRVKQGFIQTDYITPEKHEVFMRQYHECFYVCLIEDEPVGYIGVINDDIRIATHPDFQKKGIGKFMLKALANMFPTAVAKIKINNQSSLKLFESAGFKIKYYLLERE